MTPSDTQAAYIMLAISGAAISLLIYLTIERAHTRMPSIPLAVAAIILGAAVGMTVAGWASQW